MPFVKKRPPYNQNAAIRGALRRQFSRSPVVREVLMKVRREVPKYNKDGSRAKKDAVQYLCSPCKSWTKSTAVSVDHIVPVIDVQVGFVDWNEFVRRLFCGPENLQVICDTCHNGKTNAERIGRLTIQYTQDLDTLEETVNVDWTAYQIDVALLLKNIKKYIAKKKTKGLEPIVQRAQQLKLQLEQKRKKHAKH